MLCILPKQQRKSHLFLVLWGVLKMFTQHNGGLNIVAKICNRHLSQNIAIDLAQLSRELPGSEEKGNDVLLPSTGMDKPVGTKQSLFEVLECR